jgi:hypothetical protein
MRKLLCVATLLGGALLPLVPPAVAAVDGTRPTVDVTRPAVDVTRPTVDVTRPTTVVVTSPGHRYHYRGRYYNHRHYYRGHWYYR